MLAVLVLPLAVRVDGVKVVFVRRGERTLHAHVEQVVPGEITQPRMVLNVLRTVQTKSVQRLSLNQSIDEVSSLNAPALRNFGALDLDLLGQNMLSDFSPVSAGVRSASEHAFVAYDAHGEVVDSHAMRLLAHDLGCHVAWSSRGVLGVVRVPNSCNSQISDFQIAICVEHQVLRLYISVQNALLVQVFEAHEHAGDEEPGLLLAEPLVFGQVVPEITALHEVNDEVQVLTVFEGEAHVDEHPLETESAAKASNLRVK